MFENRRDAAIKLGVALEKYRNTDAIVLGIPRGGVETAYYVASHLNVSFSVLVARKIGHPLNPEYAVGALAEDGSLYLDRQAQERREDIDAAVQEQQQEIERRIQLLRDGAPLPPLTGKVVILVDDGIATGATLFAAIAMCRKEGAGHIVVAAPVSASTTVRALAATADEVVVLETPARYWAVSQVYRFFSNLTDQQALAFVRRWNGEHESKPAD